MNDIIKKICKDKNFILTGSAAMKLQGVLNRKIKDLDFVSTYDLDTVKKKIEKLFPDASFAGKGRGDYEFICFTVSDWLVECFTDRIVDAEYIKLDNEYIKVAKLKRNLKIKKLFNIEKFILDAENTNQRFQRA